jgi:hypothetical protein
MQKTEEIEPLTLQEAVTHVFEECRMVLPGIQALFGFQMIAVFSNRFAEKLTSRQQQMHGIAILLVIVAIVLVMLPAALHRRAEPKSVSAGFLRVASAALLAGMLFLALALSLDVFVVIGVLWPHPRVALAGAIGTLMLCVLVWEVYPSVYRRRRRAA